MLKHSLLIILILITLGLIVVGQQVDLAITSPESKSDVPIQPTIKGTVADPSAKVWLVVRPTVTDDYWVQSPATVNEDGTWQGTVNIGRPGNEDVGQSFQIVAVANPKKSIKEGDKLGYWPKSQWRSQVIKVKRK